MASCLSLTLKKKTHVVSDDGDEQPAAFDSSRVSIGPPTAAAALWQEKQLQNLCNRKHDRLRRSAQADPCSETWQRVRVRVRVTLTLTLTLFHQRGK